MTITAPDGRLGVVDGMTASLGTGGSGDLLAGLCAAVAARMNRLSYRCEERCGFGEANFVDSVSKVDLYGCAAAAAGLLVAAGRSMDSCFKDPLELADKAAELAGKAWL